MNPHLGEICVSPSATIREAMQRLAANKPYQTNLPAGIILVVEGRTLLGIATDGDIRRALAGGAGLEVPIGSIMNKTPFLIEGPKSNVEILSLVVDKIKQEQWHKDRLDKIVVVDAKRRVLDVVSFYDLWQSSDVRFKHVGVVGLGYVGLTLSLVLADLGFKVRGFDANPAVTRSLRAGKAHIYEAGLAALLADHNRKKFTVVDDFRGENNCDVYFVAVGTPLTKRKVPDVSALTAAAKNIGGVLKRSDLVILRSTVPVGTTREVVIPVLEKASGLTAGVDFLVSFAPERTIEGRALEELRTLPQVIGGINHASADLTANIFSFLTHSNVILDSLEEAEMVKLINNSYRDLTFAFANEIALIGRRWAINAKRVIDAANYGYARSHVPQPSPGVGGYCLEKDPHILAHSARIKDHESLLLTNARAVSDRMLDTIASDMHEFLKARHASVRKPKIFLLGFAFKGVPATSDVRGSTTVALVERLRAKGYTNIHGYDPVVRKGDITASRVAHVADPKAGFAGAHLVGVMNNNATFGSLGMRALLRACAKPAMLFDPWSLYAPEEIAKVRGISHVRL